MAGLTSHPKTSHTTIEWRYHTNLNAKIQGLRMAVPALRVLEECGGKKGKGGKGKKGDEVGVKLGVELLRCKSRIQRQILSI